MENNQQTKLFKNVYIKNFGEDMTDDRLYEMFEPFGKIMSHKVASKEDGKSKGFGFVAFETTEAAEAAVNALNGKELPDGKVLYVGRAQKKAERQQELKSILEEIKKQRHESLQGVNLYVKNLDTSFDDERLRQVFSIYGTITSVKVMLNEVGLSKGYGFVCFSSPESAKRCVTEMNGRTIGSKPLYVAFAQKKEERKAHLATQYMRHVSGVRMQPINQIFPPNSGGGFFVPTLPQPQRFFGPQVAPACSTPRWAPATPCSNINTQGAVNAGTGYQNPAMATIPAQFRPNAAPPASVHVAQQAQATNAHTQAMHNSVRAITGAGPPNMPNGTGPVPSFAQQRAPNYKYNLNIRNPPTHQQPQHQGAVHAMHQKGQEPSIASLLANATVPEQKQILGERLFRLIVRMYPHLAGKITGMLLEIENSELLYMLEDSLSLKAKVDEAVAVLQAHQAKQNCAQ